MKNLLGGLVMAGFIIGLHLVAGLIITYAPWLAIPLLALAIAAWVFVILNDLGVIEIDLSKLRYETSHRR